jgi:hypothetical protein
MSMRHLSAPIRFAFPFVFLALPACGTEADAPSSVTEDQSALLSQQQQQETNSGSSSSSGGGTSAGGGGSSSSPPTLAVTFEDCTKDSRRDEMKDAMADILANWSTFDANLTARGLTNDHDCMYDRLTKNGNVHCDVCDQAGHSSFLSQTANVCRSWASSVESSYPNSTNSRKVCWASVIMHEFGHTCLRFESGAEEVDNAARDTLNEIYGLSLDLDSECNQDR